MRPRFSRLDLGSPRPAQPAPWLNLGLVLLAGLVLGWLLFQAPRAGLELPEDAVAVTDCVMGEGQLFVSPDAEPFGPYYVTDAGGAIGVQYRVPDFSLPDGDLLEPGAVPNATTLAVNFPVAFSRVRFSEADAALDVPHAVISYYSIPEEELAVVCAPRAPRRSRADTAEGH